MNSAPTRATTGNTPSGCSEDLLPLWMPLVCKRWRVSAEVATNIRR